MRLAPRASSRIFGASYRSAVDGRYCAKVKRRQILFKSNVGAWEKYRVTFAARVSKNLLGQLHSLMWRLLAGRGKHTATPARHRAFCDFNVIGLAGEDRPLR